MQSPFGEFCVCIILPKDCKLVLFLSDFKFAQFIIPYPPDYISSLKGSDDFLIDFAKRRLKLNLPTGRGGAEKGLDMVIKVNTKPISTFIIGEAKFLTDTGGHQYSQLRDALDLITSDSFRNNGNYIVYRVAVLDGICWINSKCTKMQLQIKGLKDDEIAISALLLDSFFKSL